MTLWGGRFDGAPSDALWALTVSTADRRLLEVDVAGSLAHVSMLGAAGVLDGAEVVELSEGLESIQAEAAAGSFVFVESDEDVHTAVERRLGELVGEVAGKLHTARSRNDQIALDLRLYLVDAATHRVAGLKGVIGELIGQARRAGDSVVASYTHLQQAQAVPFAHHLLAHAWALRRDVERFEDAKFRLRVSPLGAAAGGGTRLPIDPQLVADGLGMRTTFDNSLDAVASRDVVAEYLWCVTEAMVHCSRLAGDLVLWATTEFGWATYADGYTTGSSALPHKKNPDIAELIRGKAGSAIGHLTGLLSMLKGLPLSYNRDLQQDKEHLFAADDDLNASLAALAPMIATAVFHPPVPAGWVTALDLAEALVGRGVPFREAHDIVGRLVAGHPRPAGVTVEDLAAVDDRFLPEDLSLLDPAASVAARVSPGGGSPASVATQIADLEAFLEG